MIKNYYRTAVRNLRKHKTFSFINLAGLSIGLTSFILIALYIFDELTFDSIHRDADKIYRVVEHKTSADGQQTRRAGTGLQVSERAKAEFPVIRNVARISRFWRPDIRTSEDSPNVFHEDYIAGNQCFLDVFSFPLIYGDRKTALTDPKSVLLTEETAKKFFGNADVVGKSLFFDDDSVAYKITGILKNFPVNSSIAFNLLVSESTIIGIPEARAHFSTDWNSGAFATYFLLDKTTAIDALDTRLDQLIAANHKQNPGEKSLVKLQALKDIHFGSAGIDGDSGKKGNITYVYVFFIVACFIILIACINYMNLSTARFMNRGKEIAVRKVAGASRSSLVRQFLMEVALVVIFSVLLSILFVNLALPAFNSFTEKHLSFGFSSDYRIWLGIVLMVVIVTLLAGLYPALYQSSLNPLSLLKGKIRIGKANISLRRALVVFQFMISIVLIAATIIIYQQMQYVNNKDMGFDKEQLVVIDVNSGYVRRSIGTVRNEFSKIPQVRSVSLTSTVPGAWKTIPTVKVNTDTNNPASGRDLYFFGVDAQFLSTYNIKLINGRNFYATGKSDSLAVLINQTSAKQLGITEANGQTVTLLSAKFGSDNRSGLDRPYMVTVAGIVQDFNFQSLHETIAPMIIGFDKSFGLSFGHLTVKLTGGDLDVVLKKLNSVLLSIDQEHLFEYHFLDRQWEQLYREDRIRQTVFLVIALLAIFIAALGLLGLTIYAAKQRVKEIGMRKVLGAGVSSIVFMLLKDILKLVIIAAFVAVPIAWILMHQWLQDFAYRIDINWWVFIVSTLVAVLVAMTTIFIQVVKAATANPVKSLRAD